MSLLEGASMSSSAGVFGILVTLVAIVATILICIMVLPENKRESLPKFFQILQDIFNFKSLLIEKILKVLYTFSTLFCVFVGFFMLFSFNSSDIFGYTQTSWAGGSGLLLMILGPIVVRLAYEVLMMFILLVKNTIEINNKLKNKNDDNDAE